MSKAGNGRKREAALTGQTLLTGCGFALAFGWMWFPALRGGLLPAFFAGSVFRPAVFGLGLGVGFLAGGLLGARSGKGEARRKVRGVLPAHGLGLAMLGLAFLALKMGTAAGIAANIFLALAGAVPGLWWAARLLALGPGKAVAALAVAAAATLLLAQIWARVWALSLSRPASGLPGAPLAAMCFLAVGFALACGAAWPLARRQSRARGSGGPLPVLSLGLSAALFFGLGALSVPAPAGGLGPALAHVCALALATALLNGSQPERGLVAAVGALLALAFCLPLFPSMPAGIFQAGAALPEAAALALCAGMFGKNGRVAQPALARAGLFLALALAAVNGGWLAATELRRLAGEAGPALLGLAAAFPPGIAAYRQWRKQAEAMTELALINPAIAGRLTERELALAVLLLRGFSNKALSEALGLTENTVRWHVKNLNKKTGAPNRAGLLAALAGDCSGS